VVEVDGWQHRARGSGGYSPGRPDHVMVHHTASNPGSDPDGDVAYICHGADAAPLANLYLSRSGAVHVCAGGATNTNGSGHATWSGGPPDDAMNEHAIGIEAANNGVGEPWPHVQQDAYQRLCVALCDAYGITLDHVRAHHEWAPGRKIDPAGPSMWADGSASWDMDLFRDDLAGLVLPPQPEPPPIVIPEEDAQMPFIVQNTATGQIVLVYAQGLTLGLGGADIPHWIDRYGEPLPISEPMIWDALLAKDPTSR
jgi:hypothetical protein